MTNKIYKQGLNQANTISKQRQNWDFKQVLNQAKARLKHDLSGSKERLNQAKIRTKTRYEKG